MGKLRPREDRHQEDRVRIVWDRKDVYDGMRALVRARRVHQRRVAFLDREQGIDPCVPRIESNVSVDPWPRSKHAPNLAQLSLSAEPVDRRAGLAVLASNFGAGLVESDHECVVYFLSAPDSPTTEHLAGPVPLGGLQAGRGQGNWAVSWAELTSAASCADLRDGSNSTPSAGADDDLDDSDV